MVSELDPATADFTSKLLHLAWHPQVSMQHTEAASE